MDWKVVSEQAQALNLLQVPTLSTAQRVLREVISRLKRLSPGELDLLILGDCAEQRDLLWVAVCRRYAFIGEFALEVLRERYLNLRSDVRHEDFVEDHEGCQSPRR